MIETQISILVELAKKDGEIHPRELEQIRRIGLAHGLTEKDVDRLVAESKHVDVSELEGDERFEMLQNVVQLMKADNQVFDEEILYCMEIAQKLKFPLEAVMELYPVVHSNLKLPDQIAKVRKKYEGDSLR